MKYLVVLVLFSGSVVFCSPISYEYHVVNLTKSWEEARQHCRKNHMDIASIANYEDIQRLKERTEATGLSGTFWIGLRKVTSGFEWSDGSNSPYRFWESSQPNDDGECVVLATPEFSWWDRACTYKYRFYCTAEISETEAEPEVTRQIVRVEFKSNSSLNISDLAVSEVLLNQIKEKHNMKHGDVKLSWRVQNGQVFQKKREMKLWEEDCEN